MLDEQSLEFLARDAPLRQQVVELAWPSLTVESKLQIINAIQNGPFKTTPTWLMQMCMDESAPLVRYWAARFYTFADEHDRVWPAHLSGLNLPPTPRWEKELRAKAAADSSELIRACVSKTPWDNNAQFERLVLARNRGTLNWVHGLNKAFDDGFSDEDLAESLHELLAKPEVQRDLKSAVSYNDGPTAYYGGQLVIVGWALVAKAGPKLRRLLALSLPTHRGLARIAPSALAALPVDALETLAFRATKSEEIVAALDLVLSSPEKYGEATVKALEEKLAMRAEYASDGEEASAPTSDTKKETLAQVLNLKLQIGGLTEQLNGLQLQMRAKRGVFL
ncbi:MAG: hypothetical protein JWR21_2376 [Herminiimonas sp.]|nr:hypothetical protein [Herminiimonas sp.]